MKRIIVCVLLAWCSQLAVPKSYDVNCKTQNRSWSVTNSSWKSWITILSGTLSWTLLLDFFVVSWYADPCMWLKNQSHIYSSRSWRYSVNHNWSQELMFDVNYPAPRWFSSWTYLLTQWWVFAWINSRTPQKISLQSHNQTITLFPQPFRIIKKHAWWVAIDVGVYSWVVSWSIHYQKNISTFSLYGYPNN